MMSSCVACSSVRVGGGRVAVGARLQRRRPALRFLAKAAQGEENPASEPKTGLAIAVGLAVAAVVTLAPAVAHAVGPTSLGEHATHLVSSVADATSSTVMQDAAGPVGEFVNSVARAGGTMADGVSHATAATVQMASDGNGVEELSPAMEFADDIAETVSLVLAFYLGWLVVGTIRGDGGSKDGRGMPSAKDVEEIEEARFRQGWKPTDEQLKGSAYLREEQKLSTKEKDERPPEDAYNTAKTAAAKAAEASAEERKSAAQIMTDRRAKARQAAKDAQ